MHIATYISCDKAWAAECKARHGQMRAFAPQHNGHQRCRAGPEAVPSDDDAIVGEGRVLLVDCRAMLAQLVDGACQNASVGMAVQKRRFFSDEVGQYIRERQGASDRDNDGLPAVVQHQRRHRVEAAVLGAAALLVHMQHVHDPAMLLQRKPHCARVARGMSLC